MSQPDTTLQSPSRRTLLKVGSLALGGLVIGFTLPFAGRSFAEQILNEGPEDQPMSTPRRWMPSSASTATARSPSPCRRSRWARARRAAWR